MNKNNKLDLLNVGCGATFHKDWINIDIDGDPNEIQIVDIRKGLPFKDESFDAVYSSHVLEHFSYGNGLKLLKEIYRVLKPNGIVRIVVPDLEDIARNYLKALESVMEHDCEKNAFKYKWMYMELYDQTTRSFSGGSMIKYMKKMDADTEFIFQRIGYELFTVHERELIKQLPQIEKEKKIYIFGAGSFGQRANWILKLHNISIAGYIDNSTELIGTYIDDSQIYSLNDIPKDAFIIIASTWSKEIVQQLTENGFSKYYVIGVEKTNPSMQNEKIEKVRQYILSELGSEYVQAFDEGVFRNQGEIHRHMYDQYSLKKILHQAGFSKVIKRNAFDSEIENFRSYQLDEINGKVRKPDSLFMEARKI